MAVLSILSATLATSLFASAVRGAAITRRNDYPAQAPCSYPYTPFNYVGCYIDPSIPNRALDFATNMDFQNMTVEKCTASCKANGFRYAGLEYYGQCFCGDSVRSGQAPQADCNFACSADNTETCGGYDRVSIYQDPTFKAVDYTTISDYANLGCYSEGYNGRAIAFQQNVDSTTMTTESCLQACKNSNYPLAATEYSGECYCGVVVGNGSVKADESNCNTPCAGNATEMCGGANFLNLYMAADLAEAAPCAPSVQPSPTVIMNSVSTSTAASTTGTTSLTSTLPTPVTSATDSASSSSTYSSSSAAAVTTTYSSSSAAAVTTTLASTTPSATSTSTPYSSTTSTSATPSYTSSSTPYSSVSSSSTYSSSSAAAATTSSTSAILSVTSTSSTYYSISSSTSASASTLSTISNSATSTSTPYNSVSSSTSTSIYSTPSSVSTYVTSTSKSTSSTPAALSTGTSTTVYTTSKSAAPSYTSAATSSTSSKVSTTLTVSTTTTASKCTATAPAPTAEYCVGSYCSKPIPEFNDQDSCKKSYSKCKLQVSDCYKKAGDSSPSCSKFKTFCENVSAYCTNTCSGSKCSKSDCLASNPPAGGPTPTTGVCTSTTTAPATTTSVVPPTATNICAQPTGAAGSGYEAGKAVGGIELPYLTCNDLASDYSQHPFKLYEDSDSTACRSYTRDNIPSACADACTVQYNECVGSYATSKKVKTTGNSDNSKSQKDSRRKRDDASGSAGGDGGDGGDDTYDSANTKCLSQKSDCVALNKKISVAAGRCGKFNDGWS